MSRETCPMYWRSIPLRRLVMSFGRISAGSGSENSTASVPSSATVTG
ncbi:MAG: hypothetical protein R2697_00115 [Ilumatobacteraceae bacterium]